MYNSRESYVNKILKYLNWLKRLAVDGIHEQAN